MAKTVVDGVGIAKMQNNTHFATGARAGRCSTDRGQEIVPSTSNSLVVNVSAVANGLTVNVSLHPTLNAVYKVVFLFIGLYSSSRLEAKKH